MKGQPLLGWTLAQAAAVERPYVPGAGIRYRNRGERGCGAQGHQDGGGEHGPRAQEGARRRRVPPGTVVDIRSTCSYPGKRIEYGYGSKKTAPRKDFVTIGNRRGRGSTVGLAVVPGRSERAVGAAAGRPMRVPDFSHMSSKGRGNGRALPSGGPGAHHARHPPPRRDTGQH